MYDLSVQPNPYTPGQVPRFLAGRDKERDLVRARLGQVATFGEFVGPLLAYHAPRGLGKTSLLRACQEDAAAAGFVNVWVAAARGGSLLSELVLSVGRSIARTDSLSGAEAKRWRSRLSKVALEVGVPGFKAGVELDTRPAPTPAAAPIGALEDLLNDAATLVVSAGGAGLLICIDEVHAAGHSDLAVLLNALQNIDGERSRYPLTVVAAGLPSTPEELTRAATFGERSTFVSLGRLDAGASASAVRDPAGALEVTWSKGAVAMIVDDAAGYPYFLQLLAHAAWDAAQPDAGQTLTVRDVRAGYPAAVEQLRAVYRARWKGATAAEQDFMVALAAVQGSGDGAAEVVTRAAIAVELGKDTRAIGPVRDRLIEKGIVEPAGHGLLRFTLPGFGSYVAAERGTGAAPQAREYLQLLARDIRSD